MLPNEDTIAAKPDPYVGKVLDKYKLIERLGVGGMGLVYRAEQARIKRQVAIKLLPYTLIADEVNVKRIKREATAMGKLRHPNIATIFDICYSEEGQPFIAMELIDGSSLRTLLDQSKRLDVQRALKIFAQVADAMEFAHKHGIIHRDLKPDNIMLDCGHTDDFVKVLDFGIAKSADNVASVGQSLTAPGMIVGSPLYMSPEQCLGQKLDPKSDIYSLGIVMYQALTGEIPYRGATVYETIGKKTTEAPTPFPPELELDRDLEALTLACIAPMRNDRPASMSEVKDRLVALALSPSPWDYKTQENLASPDPSAISSEIDLSDAIGVKAVTALGSAVVSISTEAVISAVGVSRPEPSRGFSPNRKILSICAGVVIILGCLLATVPKPQATTPVKTGSAVRAVGGESNAPVSAIDAGSSGVAEQSQKVLPIKGHLGFENKGTSEPSQRAVAPPQPAQRMISTSPAKSGNRKAARMAAKRKKGSTVREADIGNTVHRRGPSALKRLWREVRRHLD
ncbi:MAG: serine/threonine protein kinase [Candidatus Obscuribacterales bacterium]|nr:serine/threonine protein kinase [Candidatus Obscuribacterales bacterium]